MPAFHAAGGTTSASSASIPLEGHRLDARIPRRGRDDLRVVRVLPAPGSNFQVCSLLPQVSVSETQSQLAVASIVRSGSTATDTANTASHMGGTTSASSVDSLPSQPFITPLGASLFLHLPRGHPVQSPFASLRANLRFTPDSFHSLPLRRGSEASLHCRASSGLPTLSPLTTFILSTFPHQQRWSHLIIHFVHFFLNKVAACRIFAAFR